MCNIQLYQQAIVDPCKEVVLCLTGSKGRMNLDPGKIAELLPDIPVFVTLKTGDTKHFLYANLRSFAMPDDSFLILKAGNNYIPIRETDEKDAALEIMRIRLELAKKEIRTVERKAKEEKPKADKQKKEKDKEGEQERYRDQIKLLTGENQSLKAQNERLMQMIRDSHEGQRPLLYIQSMEEFYPDEIRQILLDVLDKGRKNMLEGSRRREIIDDILMNNEKTDLLKQMGEEIRSLVHTTERFSQEQANRFRQAGFEVEKTGSGHWKLTFHGDPHYTFTTSATPSDYKTAKAIEHTIIRTLF